VVPKRDLQVPGARVVEEAVPGLSASLWQFNEAEQRCSLEKLPEAIQNWPMEQLSCPTGHSCQDPTQQIANVDPDMISLKPVPHPLKADFYYNCGTGLGNGEEGGSALFTKN
jgi:hypothetical protein